jgi:UDP-glucose-4-epimerase GalE
MSLALAEAGHDVAVFDNLSRGHADAVRTAHLFLGDLRRAEDVDACLAEYAPELVMHFAALAYVGESVREPQSYYENNVTGTLNLLAGMRRHGVGKLVFSSTCATYGEPDHVPIAENQPQRPINPYGRTKLMIEQSLQDYAKAYGLGSVTLRYFNAAGADPAGRLGERHEPETHLIPLVLAEALRVHGGGEPQATSLEVFGSDFPTRDGTCVRDYIHVTDLCRAHLRAAGRLLEGDCTGAEAYNLGNGTGFSVLEVIQACEQVTGQRIAYRVTPRREGDPATLVADARRAREILGWQPEMPTLRDIIGTAWNWMTRQDPAAGRNA